MKNLTLNVFLAALISFSGVSAFAQVNSITFDSTFGINGIMWNMAPANYNETMAAMAVQPDGKIVVGAGSGNISPVSTVIRFLSNGVLDTTFGTGGYVFPDSGVYNAFVDAVQLLSNGRILICGASNTSSYLARLDSVGRIDSTFGQSGYVNFTSASAWTPQMLVLTDGSIITDILNDSNQTVLMKFDSNGVADHSFGSNNTFAITGLDPINTLKLDNNGNILAAGPKALSKAIGVMRISPNGQPDNTFGNNSVVLYSYYDSIGQSYEPSYNPIPVSLPDGDMIVTSWNQYENFVFAIRLLPNGSVDASYGNNGISKFLGYSQDVDALLMGNDELLVAAENYYTQGEADMGVLSTSGHVDSVFTPDAAEALFNMDTSASTITNPVSIKLLPGNKILCGGTTMPGINIIGFARFNYTGFLEGINTIEQPTDLQLYPNPADQFAMIKYSFQGGQDVSLKVYNLLGQQAVSKTISGQAVSYRLETAGLNNGVYFVELKSGSKVASQKLVVEH